MRRRYPPRYAFIAHLRSEIDTIPAQLCLFDACLRLLLRRSEVLYGD